LCSRISQVHPKLTCKDANITGQNQDMAKRKYKNNTSSAK
jgi:hypothetical protein